MGDASSFDEIWAEKTDEQLFDALAHRDQYKQEAIEAIQRQIAKRNLDSQRITEFEAEIANRKEVDSFRAQMPLQWPLRILMLFLSLEFSRLYLGYTSESQDIQGDLKKSGNGWL